MARSKELTVLAIEPLWSNLQYLYANLKANKYDDVEVFPMGVGKGKELAVLYGLGGAASMRKEWSASDVSNIIPVTTLDRLMEGRYDRSEILVKIDVEGLEYEVLKGAEKLLARKIAPLWFIEIYLENKRRNFVNEHFEDVFHLFWKHGYTAKEGVQDGKIVSRCDVQEWVANQETRLNTANYVFYRE